MKSLKFIGYVCLATLCLVQTSMAGTTEDEIAVRLERVGTVCIEGQDCGSAVMNTNAVASSGGADSPADIYGKSCSTCHAIGLAGAPKLGDVASWAPRVAKGMDTLYESVFNGLPPGMPVKGLCFTCSDDELKAVVDYMVAESQ
ncbi:MAG: cytochrome c5 [Candidatus Azotimanducaceae bacterium]